MVIVTAVKKVIKAKTLVKNKNNGITHIVKIHFVKFIFGVFPMASKTLRPLSGHGSVRGVVLGLGLRTLVQDNFFGVYYIMGYH